MNGFLLVNKEKGYSSNEIVQKIKKKFSLNKVGHLGTLDPDAEGLSWWYSNHSSALKGRWNHIAWSRLAEWRLGFIKFTPWGFVQVSRRVMSDI